MKNATSSREEQKAVEARRAARKARVANLQASSSAVEAPQNAAPKKNNTPAPAPKAAAPAAKPAPVKQEVAKPVAAPKAASVAAPPVAPKADIPRELVAQVADITKIASNTPVDIVGPFNMSTDNPHWLVTAAGEPVAKIALADQENQASLGKVFTTQSFADSFVSNLKQIPLPNLLRSCKARPYVAAVKSTEVFASVSEQYKKEADEYVREKLAASNTDLLNMVGLVVEAQRKNYLKASPLKDALFTRMRSAGLNEQTAINVVEAAFVEASPAHFEQILSQATKWQAFAPQALADVRQQIQDMEVVEITANMIPQPATPKAAELVPGVEHNVPFQTNSAGSRTEIVAKAQKTVTKDEMRSALGGLVRRLYRYWCI